MSVALCINPVPESFSPNVIALNAGVKHNNKDDFAYVNLTSPPNTYQAVEK